MARSFNGSTDVIVLGGSMLIQPTTVTYAVWVKPNLAGITNTYGRALGYSFSTNAEASLYIKNGGKLAIYCEGVPNNFNRDGLGTNTLVTGTWYHIGFTYSSLTGAFVSYVNGQVDDSASASVNSVSGSSSAVVRIGAASAGENFWYAGSIADAAIWSSVLPQPSMRALASGVRPGQISKSLVGWWPLDNYGHPALDRSGFGNNGVLTGTAFVTGPPLISAAPILAPTPVVTTAAAASSIVFRRTLSELGTRTGSRQVIGV